MLDEFFNPAEARHQGINEGAYRAIRLDKAALASVNLNQVDIALLGVQTDKNALKPGAAKAPDYVRNAFYALYANHRKQVNVIDLGNLILREHLQQTYQALTYVLGELRLHNVIPVILGGSQDVTYPALLAYADIPHGIDLVSLDYAFNWDKSGDFTDQAYLNPILFGNQLAINDYINVGGQVYFMPPQNLRDAEEHNWMNVRLGSLRNAITEAEPFIRHADFVSFDWGVMRNAWLPGLELVSPNGLEAHEACQIAKYAGMSDKNKGFGLFNYIPGHNQGFGAALMAQMIWYFIDGFSHRVGDYPVSDIEQTTKYIVAFSEIDHTIVFFQSKRSGRWWMEVPASGDKTAIVPCSYKDYQLATNQEIPDLWYKYFHKYRSE